MVLLNTIIPQRHRKYMYKWYYILGSPEYCIPVFFCGHLLSAFEWFSQFTDFFSADFRFSPNQTWISRSYYFRSPTAKIRWLQKKPTNKRVYSNRAPDCSFGENCIIPQVLFLPCLTPIIYFIPLRPPIDI